MVKKKTSNSDLLLSRNYQLAFIIAIVLVWLSPIILLLIWLSNEYINAGSQLIQLSYIALPLVFVLVAYLFSMKKYKQPLHRIFMAFFIGTIGFSVYGALSSIENSLRYKFYPPQISDFNDTSLLTAFGREWLVMGVAITVFAITLAFRNHKQKG